MVISWLDLQERYATTSAPQFYSAEQKLSEMKQHVTESIAAFFTQIKTVWDEIDGMEMLHVCECGDVDVGLHRSW